MAELHSLRKLLQYSLRTLSSVFLCCAALSVRAEVFNFDDALLALGHEGDPAAYYQTSGLTLSGIYSGVIGGVSGGNVGNFKLEGTNGPASLAAVSITTVGEHMELNFSVPLSVLCLDLGAAYFNETQTPVPLNIRIRSYLGAVPKGDRVITVEDTLKNGQGTWYPLSYAGIDRLRLESIAGGGTWAIDNIVTGTPCLSPVDSETMFFPIKSKNGKVAIILL